MSPTAEIKGPNPHIGLDATLKLLGRFGKYQIINIFLVSIVFLSGRMFDNAYIFHTVVPDYRCLIENCDNSNTELKPDWLEYAVPINSEGKPSHCERYARNKSAENLCVAESFLTDKIEKCDDLLLKSDFKTVIEDLGLYCDDNFWKLTILGTVYNAGLLLSSFIIGVFADKYGRKKTLISAIVLGSILSELKTVLATKYIYLLGFELLTALPVSGIFMCGFVLITELLGPSERLKGACFSFGINALAAAAMGTIAIYVSSWRTLVQLAALPGLLVVLYGWLMPESIRWLISKQEYEKVNQAVKKIADMNKVNLPDNCYYGKNEIVSSAPLKPQKFSNLLKSKILSWRVYKMCVCWFTCSFCVYGMSVASTSISGNFKINFIIGQLMDIPGNIICYLVATYFGRRINLYGSFIAAGVANFTFIFVPDGTWKLVFFFFGKLAISGSFTSIYIVTSEIFPTPYRQRALAICSIFGRAGSMLAPQIPLMANMIWEPLPYALFASTALLAAFISFTSFPETLGTNLPDTIEDAEYIGEARNNNNNC